MVSSYDYNTRYTREEKKELLSDIIRDAWTEQFTESRLAKRVTQYDPFEVRAFRTAKIDRLIDLLKSTEALELLAEMVGAIEEEA